MEDGERLLGLVTSQGVKIDDLTPGDQKRLIELLHAFDDGYEISSKTGMSLKDYYGNRADSEKTQRQRLRKKVKKLAKGDQVSTD